VRKEGEQVNERVDQWIKINVGKNAGRFDLGMEPGVLIAYFKRGLFWA